jgi:hypothetical protein
MPSAPSPHPSATACNPGLTQTQTQILTLYARPESVARPPGSRALPLQRRHLLVVRDFLALALPYYACARPPRMQRTLDPKCRMLRPMRLVHVFIESVLRTNRTISSIHMYLSLCFRCQSHMCLCIHYPHNRIASLLCIPLSHLPSLRASCIVVRMNLIL